MTFNLRSLVSAFSGLLLLSGILLTGCGGQDSLPSPGSSEYKQLVTAYYTGLAAIQSGQNAAGRERLAKAADLAPGEPAIWANRGVLALRQRQYEEAAKFLQRAHDLAPENAQILGLLGLLESQRGQSDRAIEYYRQTIAQDSTHRRALYALAQELERRGGDESGQQVLDILNQILERDPDNLAVLIEQVRVAAKLGNASVVRQAVQQIDQQATGWPPETRNQLKSVQSVVEQGSLSKAGTEIAFLENMLKRVPQYRQSLREVQAPVAQIGDLMTHFIRMETPRPHLAHRDSALTYTASELSLPYSKANWMQTFYLSSDADARLIAHSGTNLYLGSEQLAQIQASTDDVPDFHRAASADLNYDFANDLIVVGGDGLHVFRQDTTTSTFEEITASMDVAPAVRNERYATVFAADIEMDGDMDILLGRREGNTRVLRNSGDGTYELQTPFAETGGLRDFAWADIDADGDPDAAMVNQSGDLKVYLNQRSATFSVRTLPDRIDNATIVAVTSADLDGNAILDYILLTADGRLLQLATGEPGQSWTVTERGRIESVEETLRPGGARLFAEDLDNNGGLDIIASTSERSFIWLQGRDFQLRSQAEALPFRASAMLDHNGDGLLDVVGTTPDRQVTAHVAEGTTDYNWQEVRPQAVRTTGDQRINAFGIGGEMEVRAGLLFQKRPVTAPIEHFGLGEHDNIDLLRIIWPNGAVQAEYDLAANQMVRAEQRLKGSCPWLFAYDGEKMDFVTDVLWRSPLGLRINAQKTAGVVQTRDRVLVEADQLSAKDGHYPLRITAELWETHFFDEVALLAVDHPEDTEVWIDERFSIPPPDLSVTVTGPPRPIAGAWDQSGTEVTAELAARDDHHLASFAHTKYQGVIEEQVLEIHVGENVPASGPVWLIGMGWTRPTDSSINLALSQGSNPAPRGVRVEIPDGNGGWKVVRENMGFPAGKDKTMLFPLSEFGDGKTPERVRLRTTAEIYWDKFAWARGLDSSAYEIKQLRVERAELQYYGFSRTQRVTETAPERPVYGDVAGSAPRWRDLVGYYTRFGPVEELLARTDDRYVIMNAGDELVLEFEADGAPDSGKQRDFVFMSDGWVKDGDYNTQHSKTVRPLPYHGQSGYSRTPGRLETDPVYQRYPMDWVTYHTRYVSTRSFQKAMTFNIP